MLHTEDDCGDDDGGECSFRNESTVGHEEGQTEDDQSPSKDTS